MSREATREEILAECDRLRDVIRILTDGAGMQGMTDWRMLKRTSRKSDDPGIRVIVCAPTGNEREAIRTACIFLAEFLRGADGMTQGHLDAIAEVVESGAKNEPEMIGSRAEKNDG
jgi:hypothetical protein